MSEFGWTYGGYFLGLAIGTIAALGTLALGYRHFGHVSPWGTAVAGMIIGLVTFKLLEWNKRRKATKHSADVG